MRLIDQKAQEKNIVGVLYGSCLVGNNIGHFEAYILNSIKSALSTYKSDYSIGSNEQEEEMLLSDSLAAVIQPKGQGKKN